MSHEKRTHARVPVSLDARWVGKSVEHPSKVVNIGAGGCFVSTVARALVGDPVRVKIRVPGGGDLLLGGEVVHGQWPLGFGMRFTGLSEDAERKVRELVEGH